MPMDENVYLSCGFPPSVNNYYVKTRRGIFISKQGRLFREQVEIASLEQGVLNLVIDYRITVDVILYMPDRRVRDLDNYMKGLLDAITHAKIWVDDSLIDTLNIHRGIQMKAGKSELRITKHHGFILPSNPSVWDHID